MANIGAFLRGTRTEMKHVVWPTRTRTIIYTVIIIIFSLVLGYLLGGFDTIFRVMLRGIIQ